MMVLRVLLDVCHTVISLLLLNDPDLKEIRSMSEKLKIQIRKLLTILVSWIIVSLIISIYDLLVLLSGFSEGPGKDYSFGRSLTFNVAAGILGSVMGGTFLVFYVNERLRDKPYGYTVMAVSFSFVLIVVLITFILGFFLIHNEVGYWPYENVWATEKYIAYLTSPVHLKNFIVWFVITALTQISLQVNDKFGQGLLWAFITGKYHSPKQEKRVFMFLDLMSSTTIAEKLGNTKYYNLLRDFYADITGSIIYNGGEIYQYVGDEVVISWKYEAGIVQNKCVRCFYDIRAKIAALEPKYVEQYGLVPDFKAALHYGTVTAGEIGIIKRDITYSGDVLNTTSRILSKCNEFKEKLLISGNLRASLHTLDQSFTVNKMDAEPLRGKTELVEIYAVKPIA